MAGFSRYPTSVLHGSHSLSACIFRFYFHCKNCAAEITMKTDPKNSDYALEHGATRNYEPWRDKDKVRWRFCGYLRCTDCETELQSLPRGLGGRYMTCAPQWLTKDTWAVEPPEKG